MPHGWILVWAPFWLAYTFSLALTQWEREGFAGPLSEAQIPFKVLQPQELITSQRPPDSIALRVRISTCVLGDRQAVPNHHSLCVFLTQH